MEALLEEQPARPTATTDDRSDTRHQEP
jgi:hypothetical protein